MFCGNCGCQLNDGAKFCPQCGAEVIQEDQEQKDDSQHQQKQGGNLRDPGRTSKQSAMPKSKEKKGIPRALIPIIIGVAAAAAVVLIALGVSRSNRLDLNDYIEVEFNGYNEYGTAKVNFDWDSLSKEYDDRVSVKNSGWGWLYDSFSDMLDDCTYMSVEPKSGLSNGDQVTVSWEVDTEDLYEMLNKNIKISSDPKTFTVSGLEDVQDFDAFDGVSVEFSGFSPIAKASLSVAGSLGDQLNYTLDKKNGLANGDTVTVTIDEESANSYMLENGLYPEEMSKDFMVSGLEEVQAFDAFDGVSVEFSGTSPDATASLSVSGELGDQLTYTLDQTSGLAHGDTVTVTIDVESANAYMRNYGLYPEKLSKEYAVENITYYVSSLDEIPEEGMEKLKSQAEDVFRASAAKWNENAQFESLDYLGSYFLHVKPDVSTSKVNMIYMVYNIHAKQFGKTESGSQTETNVNYYWYIGFNNGMVLADGTFTIDYSDYSTPTYYSYGSDSEGVTVETYDYTKYNSWSQSITIHYPGYDNLDSMFNNLVVKNIDKYTYESTVPGTSSGASTSSVISNSGDSADAEQTGEDESGDYLCSFSSDRLITDADLAAIRSSDYGSLPAGRSLEQMIVNEIYAKHGYKFSTPEIQTYFEQKDWYNALGSYQSDMDIVAGQLSSIEKQNVDFLESK